MKSKRLDDLNIDGKRTLRRILKKEYNFSDWIHLALDRVQQQALVYMLMCLQVT
jgi:hypothetical protein